MLGSWIVAAFSNHFSFFDMNRWNKKKTHFQTFVNKTQEEEEEELK